jgi:hypothetical protein
VRRGGCGWGHNIIAERFNYMSISFIYRQFILRRIALNIEVV